MVPVHICRQNSRTQKSKMVGLVAAAIFENWLIWQIKCISCSCLYFWFLQFCIC